MKTRDFLLGMLACFSLGACSSEDVVDNGTKKFKDKAYMRVQIAMAGDSSSRATEGSYEYGETTEQKVHSVRFLFYDANGNFMTEGIAATDPTVTGKTDEDSEYWEAESAPVISLTLDENQPFPTQVVAYVNIGEFDFGTTERNITKDGMKVAESLPNTFVMSTSTYVDTENKIVCSTPVSSANFHETEDAAKADKDIVTIHVERLPAKVSVTTATNLVNDEIADASGNKLKFEVTGFVLNGINTSSFLLKQVDVSWNTDFNTWDGWTKPENFRCFWAKDMNYEVTTKPTDLNFFSYGDSQIDNSAKYCYENTFSLPLGNGNQNLFENATHVLVFGKYKINWANDNIDDFVELEESTNFYMYAGTAYLDEDLKKLWANAVTDVYVKEDNSYKKAGVNSYVLISDGTTVDGVTLQLVEGEYYTVDGTGIDITAKNTTLKNIYNATGYKNAVGYFPILIEHFGMTNDDDSNEDEDTYDMTTELGVVRNHIYNIEIQSIKSLAEGVFNEDIEIIPDSSVKTYYLASKLRILSWKTVNQSVDL